METGRNITLDYFKIFLSFLVITIHFQPLFLESSKLHIVLGWEISQGIARIAVPCFFILNGYFLADRIKDKEAIRKYAKRLLIIYATWTVIYISVYSFAGVYSVSLNIFRDVLLIGAFHLWYVLTLVEAAIILHLLYSKTNILRNVKIELFIVAILFVLGLIIQYKYLIPHKTDYSFIGYSRNAIFIGIPFVLLGKLIKEYEHKLVRMNSFLLITITLTGLVILLVETYFNLELYAAWLDLYISLIILCPALTIVVLKFSRIANNNDNFYGMLASAIYMVHAIPIVFINAVSLSSHPQSNFFKLPLLIFLVLILSYVTIQLNKKIKIFL